MICLECRAEVGFVLHRYPESLLLTHKSLANLFELACFYIIIIHWLVHLLIRLYLFRSYLFVHHIFNIQLQFIPFLFIYPSATLFIVSTTIVWSSSNLYFFPPPPTSSPHPRLHPPISTLFFTEGGCSCAGPFGHQLLGLTRENNKKIELAMLDKHEVRQPLTLINYVMNQIQKWEDIWF